MPERILAVRMEEELIHRIKKHAAESKITIKEYIAGLVEEDLSKDEEIYIKMDCHQSMEGNFNLRLAKLEKTVEQLEKTASTESQQIKKNP